MRKKRGKQPDPKAELRKAQALANKAKHEGPFLAIFRAKYPQLPQPKRDCLFAESLGRKFKADFCWDDANMLIVELDGGGNRSRHATVKGYANDCDKQNLAMQMGYRLLRFNVIHLKKPEDVVDYVASFLT